MGIYSGVKMSLFDIFRIKKFKREIEELKKNNELLNSLLKPEHEEIVDLLGKIESLKLEISETEDAFDTKKNAMVEQINSAVQKLDVLNSEISGKQQELFDLEDHLLLQSFALYEPMFDFANSAKYKHELDTLRSEQKRLIREKKACTGNTNWTVNNSEAQGKRMADDMAKLLIRSFNNECDSCVSNVKFNNIHVFEKRIESSYSTINKLGKIVGISITDAYKTLKMHELHLAYEFQLKKQEEKEEQRQIREQMREEARLQRELEEARKTVEKEKRHYTNALKKVIRQLEQSSNDEERKVLEEKVSDLEQNLTEISKQFEDIDYREANQKAGYVYVVSNIGSFGENIYKIGMTRRLDPYDRVYELGDASVPFNFDVHAMIFSHDAPGLEAALHREFELRRLNLINRRREYFAVTLEEIESVVLSNHDKTVEFITTAAAEEFRESAIIRKERMTALKEIDEYHLMAAAAKNT